MRQSRLILVGTLLFGACPPTLSGGPCSLEQQDCPTGQTCAALADGGGVCIGSSGTGTTSASSTSSGGSTSGTTSAATTGTSSTSSTSSSSGQIVFAGKVQLNGGAVPVRDTWVYGFQGAPFVNGMSPGGYAFVAVADAGGIFAISGPVTDGSYGFAAQYDLDGDGLMNLAGDAIAGGPVTSAEAGNANRILLDVETATCLSVTVQFAFDGGAATYLVGVAAGVVDIGTNLPFTHPKDLSMAVAKFDAGEFPLTFSTGSGGEWSYAVPADGGQELSDTGAFIFALSDTPLNGNGRPTPQYPNGTCTVGYAPPPGFPSGVAVVSQSATGKRISWTDPNPDAGATFVGDVVSIRVNATNAVVFVSDAGSPIDVTATQAPGCTVAGLCTAEIVSYFSVIGNRSQAVEGGGVLAAF